MAAAYLAVPGVDNALPGLKPLLGPALVANSAAVTAYFVGVMATFVSMFAFNCPKIGTNATRFMGGLLSGKSLESAPEPARQQAISGMATPEAMQAQPADEPRQPMVALREYQSFQELVAQKTSDNSPALFTKH